jgi:hypothetical protein
MVHGRQGIDSEDSVKDRGPVARFFISGWTNIVRMMASNALFVIFNIPAIILAGFISMLFVPWIAPSFIDVSSYIDPVTGDEAVLELYFLLAIFGVNFLLSSTLICIGPFQAGFVQVYKDIRNDTSVSFFSSFKTGLKTNWKKGLAAMIIGLVITPVLLLASGFYLNFRSTVGTVIGMVFIVLIFAFVLVQNFVYVLMVSTDLKLWKIYKNAIIFVLIKAGPCLGAFLVVFLFYFVIPFYLLMSASYLTLGIFIFLYSFIVVSWVQYFMTCFTGRLIDRYVASDKNAD